MSEEKHYVYFLATRDGSRGIYHTAFHNRDKALAQLKSLPKGRFYITRTSIIGSTASKAFYATVSFSETIDGKKEVFARSRLHPTKNHLKENYILEDPEAGILHETKHENAILIEMDDGFYHYHIKSVKII